MKRYAGLMPGLVALAVYNATTCRSIWIGDSGEFSLALQTLGIVHPPGYPLFTILGRVFVQALPFLRPAFAANIFGTVVAAAAVLTTYYVLRRRLSKWLSMALSLVFAFCPVFWAETAGVEVYTLNLLLIALALWAAESTHPRRWLVAAYAFGLALANHPVALAILPALLYLFIADPALRGKSFRKFGLYPAFVLIFILTGSLYLYLLIRAGQHPVSNWGSPDTLPGLLAHVTMRQYAGWVKYSLTDIATSFALFWRLVMASWGWLGAIALGSGVIIGWLYDRQRTVAAILLVLATVFLASSSIVPTFEPFYIPAMFGSLILIARTLVLAERLLRTEVWRRILAGAVVILAAVLVAVNFAAMDKSRYTLSEDYSRFILDSAEHGVLFTAGDINSFTTLYLRYAENYRPGVEVYDRSIRLRDLLRSAESVTGEIPSDYYEARATVIANTVGQKYLTKSHYIYQPNWLAVPDSLHSFGILYQIGGRSEWSRRRDSAVEFPSYPVEFDPGDVLSRQLLVNLDLARGEDLLSRPPHDTSAAMASFDLAVKRLEKEERATVLNDVGIYFRTAGFLDLALEVYTEALAKPIIKTATRRNIIYNTSNVYKDRGNLSIGRGDYTAGLYNYEEALKRDPDNSQLLLNIGLIYLQALGDTSSARPYLENYLAKNPGDARIRRMLQP